MRQGMTIAATLLAAASISHAYANDTINESVINNPELKSEVIPQNMASHVTSKKVTSDYAKTQYPIVFNHGMLGFIKVGTNSIGLDYFYQILPNLARNGGNVWATRVSPFNSNEVRGEQLRQQVEEILAVSGSEKVNLIGHSQGGATSRYVAGVMPSQIASITSVGSPHRGSGVADLILSIRDNAPVLEKPIVGVVNFISQAVVWAQGLDPKKYPHNSLGTAESLSIPGAAKFNAQFPAGIPTTECGEGEYISNGIYNFSYSGVKPVTNLLDLDSILGVTGQLMKKEGKTDGLVAQCSAKFGKTIRDDLPWNHLDEVNQLFGLKGVFAPDPVDVYRQHANRLKSIGL